MIAEKRRDEQRKIIKFNHLVTNCLMLYNVFVVSKELQQLAQEGHAFDEQAIAALSPYIRHHINRFGHYQLDLAQPSPPLEYDLPVPTKKREEKLLNKQRQPGARENQRRCARRR